MTSYISNARCTFVDFHTLTDLTVKGIGREPASANGQGTVVMTFDVEGQEIQHWMKDVLYAPEALNRLLSVLHFEDAGRLITFKNGKCSLCTKDGRLVGCTGRTRQGRLYLLDAQTIIVQEHTHTVKVSTSWNDWHWHFGHVGISSLEPIAHKNLVDGFDVDTTTQPTACDACIQSKQTMSPFPKEAEGQSIEMFRGLTLRV